MPSKPFVCVGAPEAMAGAETFEQIDRAIMEAITAGWPTWETPGQGGPEPSRQLHKFEYGSLVEGARIDFYRGQASDDWSNVAWAELFENLPHYGAHLQKIHSTTSTKGKGNAMELVVGLSYACFTNFRHLPPGHTLTFPGKEDWAELFVRWAEAWPRLQSLGINATLG